MTPTMNRDHLEARIDLAAALRWTAKLDMHESIANHFSLAVSDDGKKFLVNPYGVHFSRIKASDLVLVDADDDAPARAGVIDPTAMAIHGAMHRDNPQARCVLHCHSPYATAVSCLADPEIPPIDQNTMRFYGRVAYDSGYDGMGLGDEAIRLSRMLGNKNVMMMGQHGILTVGRDVAEAFDLLYYLERSCKTYILALSTGRKLNVATAEVAEKTARQWEEYGDMAQRHLAAIKATLDAEGADYRS